jgi:hypothetical protein
MFYRFFIYLCVCGNLSCFCIVSIMSNVAMNMGEHISLWGSDFIFFEYVFRKGIVRP